MSINLDTQIDQNTLDKLKTELSKKQFAFLYEKIESESFKDSIKEHIRNFVNAFMDKKITYYFSTIESVKKDVDWDSLSEVIQKYLFKYARMFFEFEKEYIKNYDVKVSDLVTEQLVNRIESAIDEPFDLNEKDVWEIVDQPAFKELFVTLVYSALERFVKNIPFVGNIGSFEKDIKGFISNSMNFIMNVVIRFITDKKNEKLIQDTLKRLLHILLKQKLDLIVNRLQFKGFKDNEEQIFKELFNHLIQTKLVKEGLEYTLEQLFKVESEKTIREIISNPELENKLVELAVDKFQNIALEYIKSDSVRTFVKKNIDEFYDSIQI